MALRICNPQQGSMLFLLLLLGDYKSPGFNRSNLFLRRIANPPGRLAGFGGSVSNPPGRLVGLRYLLSGNVFYQFLGCTVFEYYFVFLVQ